MTDAWSGLPRSRVAAATVSRLSMHNSRAVAELQIREQPSRPKVVLQRDVEVVHVFRGHQAIDAGERVDHQVRIPERERLDEPVDLTQADRLDGLLRRADETDDDLGGGRTTADGTSRTPQGSSIDPARSRPPSRAPFPRDLRARRGCDRPRRSRRDRRDAGWPRRRRGRERDTPHRAGLEPAVRPKTELIAAPRRKPEIEDRRSRVREQSLAVAVVDAFDAKRIAERLGTGREFVRVGGSSSGSEGVVGVGDAPLRLDERVGERERSGTLRRACAGRNSTVSASTATASSSTSRHMERPSTGIAGLQLIGEHDVVCRERRSIVESGGPNVATDDEEVIGPGALPAQRGPRRVPAPRRGDTGRCRRAGGRPGPTCCHWLAAGTERGPLAPKRDL